MNCEYYTNNCKVILTTGNHKLILCNESTASPVTQPTTNNPLPIDETTTRTEPSIEATTKAPTTVGSTTYSPTTLVPDQEDERTPTPYLRGHTTTASSSYTTTTRESKEEKRKDLESSSESTVRYIYVKTNLTKQEPSPQELIGQPPDLTPLWICIGVLAAGLIALICKHYLCKKKRELKRRRSITPDNPPPVNRQLKNRNSWSQDAKVHDVLLHMNQMHERRVPREHRKSMEALRKQIEKKRRKPPAVPTKTIDLSQVVPPKVLPNVQDARNRLTAITTKSMDAHAKPTDKKVMTITELAAPDGMEKLKAIRQERRGVNKLRSQVRKLQSINKTVTSDK